MHDYAESMSFNKGEVFAMTRDWTAVTNKDHKYLGKNSKASMSLAIPRISVSPQTWKTIYIYWI